MSTRKSARGANPRVTQAQHSARRARFISLLEPESVAIIVSNPESSRSNDTEFEYRQSSDILYLTGFPEPECVLVLSNIKDVPELTMLVRPKDKTQETWTGRRQGTQGAKRNFHANRAEVIEDLEKVLGELLPKASNVYYAFGRNASFDEKFRRVWTERGQKPLLNPEKVLHEMRLFKAPEEVACMRRASDISAFAHVQAMRVCKPGMNENQLQSVLEAVFTFNGADAPAYGSIVAGGNNAVILHYENNDCPLHDGDLVLIDAACEFGGYASDITRTFPVNGKFSQPQREIYELVLKAQLACIAASKPGVTLEQVHKIAENVMRKGLVELGILPKKARKGDKKALTLGDVFMHGTSHWIGLDVHDVGTYTAPGSKRRKDRPVQPGMAFTVEPGLYFDAKDERVPKRYRGIGVRIEDDILITEDGNKVLTAGVPKTVADIEALMSAPGESAVNKLRLPRKR